MGIVKVEGELRCRLRSSQESSGSFVASDRDVYTGQPTLRF